MLKIRSFVVTNKILAVCLAILMSISFAFAANSFSKTENTQTNCSWYQNRRYYNDAAHTTQVGYWVWFCDGYVGKSGQVTPYYDTGYCECFEEPPF